MKHLIFILVILLSACSAAGHKSPAQNQDNECFNTYLVANHRLVPKLCEDSKQWRLLRNGSYSLLVPGNLFRYYNSPSEIVFASGHSSSISSEFGYDIQINTFSGSICGPSLTGVTKKNEQWGKVDFFDNAQIINSPELPRPKCRPPEIVWDLKTGKRPSDYGSAYALCSQKNGKTVLICISQQKDNPDIAKQIFESFRWTDAESSKRSK